MTFNSQDIVFFFGAGASAPFGIPTMKQFVFDFEKELNENGSNDEKAMYSRIKNRLEERLHDSVDLEGVFTVIDGIMNCCPERLGLLSLYLATEINQPNKFDVDTCKSLKQKFHSFVREKCFIPEPSFGKISEIYRDFFNRFMLESSSANSSTCRRNGDYSYCTEWTMFTTNYDTLV